MVRVLVPSLMIRYVVLCVRTVSWHVMTLRYLMVMVRLVGRGLRLVVVTCRLVVMIAVVLFLVRFVRRCGMMLRVLLVIRVRSVRLVIIVTLIRLGKYRRVSMGWWCRVVALVVVVCFTCGVSWLFLIVRLVKCCRNGTCRWCIGCRRVVGVLVAVWRWRRRCRNRRTLCGLLCVDVDRYLFGCEETVTK